jgi:hypothetical protein
MMKWDDRRVSGFIAAVDHTIYLKQRGRPMGVYNFRLFWGIDERNDI